ncbi:unnamed protein product [Calicophoron daubneyi]|uniref:SCP domain-containing protein n=1 Tax=Calicophoron daubneyi TaxID=300641 RepID=A0AAV2U004_CALDB
MYAVNLILLLCIPTHLVAGSCLTTTAIPAAPVRVERADCYLLREHNEYRKKVAMGLVDRQPAAKNLGPLEWDETLAIAAKEWAINCDFKHERPAKYGENLYFSTNENGDATRAWFDEHSLFTFGPLKSGGFLHYTQMVWADTTRLGCVKQFCSKLRSGSRIVPNAYLTVCKYDPRGNWLEQKPYEDRTT